MGINPTHETPSALYESYMHVLFVTSELAGVFKLGGLADVSLSLPLALARAGVHVTIALPFYRTISISDVSGVGELAVDFKGKREIVFIFSKQSTQKNMTLLLFRHPYLNDYHATPIEQTFAFFCKVISTFYFYNLQVSKDAIQIVHCHDWHTALVPMLIGESNKLRKSETMQSKNVKTIVTIHNLLYQGVAKVSIADDLNAPRALFHQLKGIRKGKISFLREGLEYADCISTVSPSYAREIVASSHQDAIGDVLSRRHRAMVGILNGINMNLWNPAHDAALPHHYDLRSVFSEKPKLKKLLQREAGLPTEDVPLVSFIGRIEPRQKGIDIAMEALRTLARGVPIQAVFLGTGNPKSVRSLRALARRYKKKIAFIHAFDEVLARRIYAGSDMLLVPSRFEPCGLIQMIAMRYGTVPIVRATGGLADTVHPGKNGFTFGPYSAHALSEAILRALGVRESAPATWRRIIETGMHEDFSWDKSAKEYIRLYRKL
jgi:starch synthase